MSSFAIDDGKLLVCGVNEHGELGLKPYNDVRVFTKIPLDFEVVDVVHANYNTIIKDIFGNLWSCGANFENQLGFSCWKIYEFTKMSIKFSVDHIVSGIYHTIIMDTEGNIWTCGEYRYGQVNLGWRIHKVNEFTKVPLKFSVVDVVCSDFHTIIKDEESNIWSCGKNKYGELGLGHNYNTTFFCKVSLNFLMVNIACSNDRTMIIDDEGNLWVCGCITLGQLCHVNIFNKVSLDFEVVEVVGGGNNNMIIRDFLGIFWCHGENYYGQLGLGHDNYVKLLTKINLDFQIVEIVCSCFHTIVIDEKRNIWICGKNDYGQLGLGHKNKVNSFTKVPNIKADTLFNQKHKIPKKIKSANF